MIGLIGYDGRNFVVWGLGSTLSQARDDARGWSSFSPSEVDITKLVQVEISGEQSLRIMSGIETIANLGIDLTTEQSTQAMASLGDA